MAKVLQAYQPFFLLAAGLVPTGAHPHGLAVVGMRPDARGRGQSVSVPWGRVPLRIASRCRGPRRAWSRRRSAIAGPRSHRGLRDLPRRPVRPDRLHG
eukprot:2703249-Pyramimonas_sp.AAC.1